MYYLWLSAKSSLKLGLKTKTAQQLRVIKQAILLIWHVNLSYETTDEITLKK